MKQINFKSLHLKMVLVFGACFIFGIGGLLLNGKFFQDGFRKFILQSTGDYAEASVKKFLLEKAQVTGGHIKAELEVAMDAARTLADVFAGVKDKEILLRMDREKISGILKSLLIKNKSFLGTYTLWEPNAFDERDDLYANTPGHDSTGRFIPYWSRGKEGNSAVMEPLTDYENQDRYENSVRKGEYYLLPRERKKECVIDPYSYMVQGKNVWIISVVVPILVNDSFYGITGVDIGIDFMQSLSDRTGMELYSGSASIAVVSHNGILVSVSRRPDLIGKHIRELEPKDWQEHMRSIKDVKEHIVLQDKNIQISIPVEIGRSETSWLVLISLPQETAMAEVKSFVDEIDKRQGSLIFRQIGISFIAVFLGLAVIWFFAARIASPIRRAIEGLNEISAQVNSGSAQIASASQQLSETTSEQAASVQQTSSSLDAMSAMARQNAGNAGQAKLLLKETMQVSEEAEQSMRELMDSMSEISEAGEKIHTIIKTIDEIAFQTNLLALNAAIEAARAGEVGAGFAVVADEVRSLAKRAGDAAKDTAVLIGESSSKIRKGSETVSKTGSSLTKVSEKAKKTNDLMAEIAASSEEQKQGIVQMNEAIAEISRSTQQNSATAEETASAAEQLNAQSEQMEQFVSDMEKMVGG